MSVGEEEEKTEKDQLQKFAKMRMQKATHHTPFLYEAMATIHMTTSNSLGAHFPSHGIVANQKHPFNGDHWNDSVKFPSHVFPVTSTRIVPKCIHSKIMLAQTMNCFALDNGKTHW
jgi:hypothetical protein